jgi:hypothetical protein
MKNFGLSVALIVMGSALGFAACGGDDDDDVSASGGAPAQGGNGQGGAAEGPACETIAETCHPVDPGTGPLHECHETAEQGDPAWCVANGDSCLAQCRAAAESGAGGAGGSGGAPSDGAGGSALGGAPAAGASTGGAGGAE